jgi:hypothetical protein
VSRRTEGAALIRGIQLASVQLRTALRAEMHAKLADLRTSFALNHEATAHALAETRAELDQAKAELERLQAITIAHGLEPSSSVH